MKKWIAFIVLIVAVVIGYNYIYQDHRNISAEVPEFLLNAGTIKDEFVSNVTVSEKKYLNKTVTVIGYISASNNSEIILNSSVFCQLNEKLKSTLKKDSKIKIKGRIIGYDDLLELVKLDQCTLTKY